MSRVKIILNILELLACIVGFIYWDKTKRSHWKCFPLYLLVIVITEIVGNYLLYVNKNLNANIALYSYFGIPIQFLFFYWIFYNEFKQTKNNKWPLMSAAIYLSSLIADLFYISKVKFYFESFSYLIGCLFLLVLLLIYFIKFLRSDEIIKYKSSMMFWVSLGLLVFYIGAMPFFAFRKALYVTDENLFYVYWYIQFGLNYLMYLLFIASFIWGKPK